MSLVALDTHKKLLYRPWKKYTIFFVLSTVMCVMKQALGMVEFCRGLYIFMNCVFIISPKVTSIHSLSAHAINDGS